jgi:hypothetical protein
VEVNASVDPAVVEMKKNERLLYQSIHKELEWLFWPISKKFCFVSIEIKQNSGAQSLLPLSFFVCPDEAWPAT